MLQMPRITALLALLFSTAFALEAADAKPKAKSSPSLAASSAPAQVSAWSATWRSALVPGWGQWKRGDGWWGLGYLGGTVLAGGMSYFYLSQGNANFESYKNATTVADATRLYDATTGADNLHRLLTYTAIGLYGLNVADAAFLTGWRQTRMGQVLPQRSLILADGHGSFALSFSWSL